MIELVSDGIIPNTHNKTWLIDTASELSQLEVEFGNEAYCIADRTTYICNGQGNWVEKGGGGGGSSVEVEPLSVTENGEYDAGEGKAYNPVYIDVTPSLSTRCITENGSYHAAEDGFDGYSDVDVYVTPRTESLYADHNDIYTPDAGVDGFSSVQVDVPSAALGYKYIDSGGTYSATDDGLDGYSEVYVDVSGATQFVSEGSIQFPMEDGVTSGSIIEAMFAGHKYFDIVVDEQPLPLTIDMQNGTVTASYTSVDEDNVILMIFLKWTFNNLQLELSSAFLGQVNTDGTGFIDLTSEFQFSVPASLVGYYW